MEHASYHPSGM